MVLGYYPFGLKHKGYNYVINGTDHLYGFGGMEEVDNLGIGYLDYGARLLDPALGRWFSTDPYSDIYEDHSPYNYALSSPITVLDPDGKLVVYVNGFRKEAYENYLKAKAFLWTSAMPPGLLKAPWDHEERFFDRDEYRYWTKFDIKFKNNEEESRYVDGMFKPLSSADDRFGRGFREGKLLAEKIKTGEITLKDGEVIKLVGHSHGGAHAMGMAEGLLSSNIDPELIKVFLFASHQPNQTDGVEVDVYQFSRKGDKVSSKGPISYVLNSHFEKIDGANLTTMPDGNEDGRGNHGIETYTAEELAETNPRVYQWLIEQGFINGRTGEIEDKND